MRQSAFVSSENRGSDNEKNGKVRHFFLSVMMCSGPLSAASGIVGFSDAADDACAKGD
jgi:hypothetical protein